MATITLQYDARNKFVEALINLIKVSDSVKIVETKAAQEDKPFEKDEILAEMEKSREEAMQLVSKKKRKTYTKKQILDMI